MSERESVAALSGHLALTRESARSHRDTERELPALGRGRTRALVVAKVNLWWLATSTPSISFSFSWPATNDGATPPYR